MKQRFFTMSTLFAAMVLLFCLALGSAQPQTTYAAERATVQAVQTDAMILDRAAESVQALACRTAATHEQQADNPFAELASPLRQGICCGWVYWCDYYYCYYYEECWYC